jgi:glycosyltransferase involved in cell wall biosynthesis
MLACRLLDLTESAGNSVDLFLGLKFPAYLIPHPNKVLWIVHQHRAAYELWNHPLGDFVHYPNGAHVRDAIRQADQRFIAEARAVFTISANVAQRLKKYCGIDAEPLYPPPQGVEQFYCATAEDYFFYPSRLSPLKRQALVMEALAHTRQPVCVRFTGAPEHPTYAEDFQALVRQLRLDERVSWLGYVTEDEKRRHYAHALGVIFPPIDEDYGYVTLEAMLAAKPVITCTDSGGPLEFVRARETGLITEPTPQALAAALDELWENRDRARGMGESGCAHYHSLGISWDYTVQRLLG